MYETLKIEEKIRYHGAGFGLPRNSSFFAKKIRQQY